jgi:hypothetical protein
MNTEKTQHQTYAEASMFQFLHSTSMTDLFRGEMWIAFFLKWVKKNPYQGAPAEQFLKRFYNPTSNNNHGANISNMH